MSNSMESLLYGLIAIGAVVAFVAICCGINHLCKQYLKRSKRYDDK